MEALEGDREKVWRVKMKCYLCKKRIEKGYLTYTVYGKKVKMVEVCESCYLRETDRCGVCRRVYVRDVLEEVGGREVCDRCNE